MWYNRLSQYLLKEGYANNPICPCVFIKKTIVGFAILAIYVDDLNLIGIPEELINIANYLKKEFEMKDLRKKKLSRLPDRALFRWCLHPSINVYRKSLETFLYG